MKNLEAEAPPSVWNSLYDDERTPWRSGGLTTIARQLLSKYAVGRRLLEIGCGTGSDAVSIARMGFDYSGLDISDVAIQCAKKRNLRKPLSFNCADFFQWSNEEPFDVIYEKGFFHGLAGRRRRNNFVRRVAAQLAPTGIWISVCGAADQKHEHFSRGAIYLRDLIEPAEVYFEVLEIVKDNYGLADPSKDFPAWYSALRRY